VQQFSGQKITASSGDVGMLARCWLRVQLGKKYFVNVGYRGCSALLFPCDAAVLHQAIVVPPSHVLKRRLNSGSQRRNFYHLTASPTMSRSISTSEATPPQRSGRNRPDCAGRSSTNPTFGIITINCYCREAAAPSSYLRFVPNRLSSGKSMGSAAPKQVKQRCSCLSQKTSGELNRYMQQTQVGKL
jgi:hypothetical protein